MVGFTRSASSGPGGPEAGRKASKSTAPVKIMKKPCGAANLEYVAGGAIYGVKVVIQQHSGGICLITPLHLVIGHDSPQAPVSTRFTRTCKEQTQCKNQE